MLIWKTMIRFTYNTLLLVIIAKYETKLSIHVGQKVTLSIRLDEC